MIISLSLGALAFSLWYGIAPKQNLVGTESLSSSPDYFITKVQVREFNAEGVMVETMNAEQTLHYTAKSRTLLEYPTVEHFSPSGSWNAQAEKGAISDGSNDILLTDNANATKKHLQSDDIKLTADSIHYQDANQSLTSQGNAKLISTQGETTAETITTYVNSEDVVMTGSVRGKYETIY
ncbi:LPS export ABC transporter periplasmic protein LptC [Marinomonas profundi]|uniref:LPS export ABC transporter periplasmic protein LptC n=1 Tax=Marinomonas profundi TaxID=2726122 RepID=UPI001E55BDF7|nr:LPS export ABC transporter periplasmic protein LptC [Marinomonas profundi]